MGIVLGINAKLYRNTGTYASPTWDLVSNVKDLTRNLETAEADVTTRANAGWRATETTLKDGSLEFEMIYDTADADFTAFESAYFNNTAIEILALDGPVATAGSKGLRMLCKVSGFSITEPLEDALTVSVTLKPTYSANPPAPFVVGS